MTDLKISRDQAQQIVDSSDLVEMAKTVLGLWDENKMLLAERDKANKQRDEADSARVAWEHLASAQQECIDLLKKGYKPMGTDWLWTSSNRIGVQKVVEPMTPDQVRAMT